MGGDLELRRWPVGDGLAQAAVRGRWLTLSRGEGAARSSWKAEVGDRA